MPTEPTDLRKVITDVLRSMNFEVDSLTDETPLGDGGLELESLSMAELVMQLEEFGVTYTDDEMESLTAMTFGEFAEESARRTAAN